MELKQVNMDTKEILKDLLIVPYGIETSSNKESFLSAIAFNRTLWN